MTPSYPLPDSEEAQRVLAQSVWAALPSSLSAERVQLALECALTWVTYEAPQLPPLGLLLDFLPLVYDQPSQPLVCPTPVGLPTALLRRYEEYVLGKLYADPLLGRACETLLCYPASQRLRGLAYLLHRLCDKHGWPTLGVSGSVLKTLLQASPAEVFRLGSESLLEVGWSPILQASYDTLITQFQHTGDLLLPVDLAEIAARLPLQLPSDRLALRQILQASVALADHLPQAKPAPTGRSRAVPTKLYAEDYYPVGGYTSLSNRGSIESLLHSQLAYMERDEKPDLFDIKYLRDELLYFARDENEFLRQRRTFVFVLSADLVRARVKDAHLAWQRGVLLLGWLHTLMQKLLSWLGDEALRFVLLFPGKELRLEQSWCESLWSVLLQNHTLELKSVTHADEVSRLCQRFAERSRCEVLVLQSAAEIAPNPPLARHTLVLASAAPKLYEADELCVSPEQESALAQWAQQAASLLAHWL